MQNCTFKLGHCQLSAKCLFVITSLFFYLHFSFPHLFSFSHLFLNTFLYTPIFSLYFVCILESLNFPTHLKQHLQSQMSILLLCAKNMLCTDLR
uniref:Uncharacterized protein n=1 Tax=Anguilla anguilla TaxID=7936 RepID=A0A0E9WQC4_ANGAN